MTTGSIVLDTCKEFGIPPSMFFGSSRRPDVVNARRIAIERFIAAGFSKECTARMVKRDRQTVRYWTIPRNREHRVNRRRRKKLQSN